MSSPQTIRPDPTRDFADLSPAQARNIDEVCDYFEHQLYTEGHPRIEDLLGGFAEPERKILFCELLLLELETLRARGENVTESVYRQRFGEYEPWVREAFSTVFPDPTQPLPNTSEPARAAPYQYPSIPNYRVLRRVGQGAMGTVFEAIHTRLGTRVALKVLRKKPAEDLEAGALFEREMKVIGTLSHPNIVGARHADVFQDQLYLVLEYIEGLDLAEIVRRLKTLSVDDACEMGRCIALALQHAHEHRLVHRDIKPQNILLGRAGPGGPVQVKVADFGLAALLGFAPLRDPHVSYARIAGTFPYMAPEVYWEHRSDICSDVYSLGCTLWCLLLGEPPFPTAQYRGRSELMRAHRSAPLPDIRRSRPDVSPELEAILRRMLAKRSGGRFRSPAEVADALQPFTGEHDLANLLERAETASVWKPQRIERSPAWEPCPGGEDANGSVPREASLESTVERDTQPEKSAASRHVSPETLELPLTRPQPPGPPQRESRGNRIRRDRRLWLAILGSFLLLLPLWRGMAWLRQRLQMASVDLLAQVRPDRDALDGNWHWEGSQLVSPATDWARLQVPYPLPQQYQLTIQASCSLGGCLVVGLISNGQRVPVVLETRRVVAENRLEAPPQPAWELPEGVSLDSHRDTYVCVVRKDAIVVAFEEEVLLVRRAEDGPPPAPDTWTDDIWNTEFLMLGTHNSVYYFQKIVLTALPH